MESSTYVLCMSFRYFLPILVLMSLTESAFTSSGMSCTWHPRGQQPEVYWINMDKSRDRRESMISHLKDVGLVGYRVRGLTPDEIFIPEDIQSTWQTAQCKLSSNWYPPQRSTLNNSLGRQPFTSVMVSLCGRGKKKNSPKELGCTNSHLVAMREAIYAKSQSRYALIFEDDVHIPFDVDFEALAKSAPAGFGILQLFNSNQASMEGTWLQYVKNNNNLWMKRQAKRHHDFWSTCAYLIDREVMKPIIDAVVYELNGWTAFKVVAGINSPCVPRECCANGTDNFTVKPPCVWAPRGFQADSFLYAMTTTYMLSMPLISNGLGGNQSTFHQDHVENLHRDAFRRQRQYINEMLSGRVPPPPFAKPACFPIEVGQI